MEGDGFEAGDGEVEDGCWFACGLVGEEFAHGGCHGDAAAVVAEDCGDAGFEFVKVGEVIGGECDEAAPVDVGLAVEEIARRAADPRFVQVLVPAMGELPLRRRVYWPIYAACERHGLPLLIHAGSAYRQPVTAMGWPVSWLEDYVDQPQAFQAQLASLVSHGVFQKFPGLKVVLGESGITWLPSFLWRFSKNWQGLRMEIPWVDREPLAIVRDHVRLTLQPIDAPPGGEVFLRVLDQLGTDETILYSSDYPHWQFEGEAPLPDWLPADLRRRLAWTTRFALMGGWETDDGSSSAGCVTSGAAAGAGGDRHHRL